VQAAKENRNTKNSAAVTVDDLERIKEMCFLDRQGSEADFLKKQKLELYKKSQDRAKNWGNTIANQRIKR
jgi:hypothetical protein